MSCSTFGVDQSLRVAIIGLTHAHVQGILERPDRGDLKIVGIVEADRELALRYAQQHGFSMDLVVPSMERLMESVELDAVSAFGSTFQHLEVVEFFAPLGVHIMVEKPLALNLPHAARMAQLAQQHNVQLLTNYETTWYPSFHRAYDMLHDEQEIGALRKVIAHAGHAGPQRIGANQEFLNWLTDPQQSGGGALSDFGCYGINSINWLTANQRTAVSNGGNAQHSA